MKSKGFTVIELMIVIAIIGILTSFSISSWRIFKKISSNKQIEIIVEKDKKIVDKKQTEITIDKDNGNMIQYKKQQSKFQGEY